MGDLKEPSTWRGVAGLLAITGVTINPEVWQQIGIVLGAVLSLIEIFRTER